ncbi:MULTISPECIES: glycosyltransferase family 4 protein [Pseudanabaena]|uniref:glycosyltransferase family 4 protein n=1 Tax=Pseudanabaena TaxID=1152 RepID=UPI00247961B3|nr:MULTISPECIES: glycosyltransferase family 4 protein [Pseudanabaena]MEA5488865.1 glycosyltransferase family 4 protein [Pseudanabaena sp. CCNP1317]WGS72352.1 glycosyltransferase family 4 protein [Pseudanabaena galeata CCNP1313]
MKILLAIHHPLDPNLGAPGVTWRLGQEYIKLGHEVKFFSFDDMPNFLPELVKAVIFPEFLASKMPTLIKQEGIDVIDASTGDSWVWAKWIKPLSKKTPLLVTRSHGLEHTVHLQLLKDVKLGKAKVSWKYPIYHGGFHLWEVAKSMQLADLVLCLNQHDMQYSIKQLGVSAERVHVVNNGISSSLLGLSMERLSEDSKIRIAHIGSYIPRKGIEYSVPALNRILQKYPDIEVSFLGAMVPPERVLADFDPSFHDRIHVISKYQNSDLPSLLAGHSIHLFPSLSEGWGLAVVEAMACGLAPIISNIPGPTEMVKHDFDALVVPPRDTEAIEEAITKLIGDRAYLEKLRNNAYKTAQSYSYTNIAKQNLDLYNRELTKVKG